MTTERKSSDYKQTVGMISNIRGTGDKVVIAFAHDELISINPLNAEVILDTEILLTPNDAKSLADNIYKYLEKIGVIQP